MPELPEIEAISRLLGEAVAGAEVESVMAPGLNTVKTFRPAPQVLDERAKPTDRRSRLLIRLADGRELRLREFGTHQRAWARVVEADSALEDESIKDLGPDAWPEPPDLQGVLVGRVKAGAPYVIDDKPAGK